MGVNQHGVLGVISDAVGVMPRAATPTPAIVNIATGTPARVERGDSVGAENTQLCILFLQNVKSEKGEMGGEGKA